MFEWFQQNLSKGFHRTNVNPLGMAIRGFEDTHFEVGTSRSQDHFVNVKQLVADLQHYVSQHVMWPHREHHLET